MHLTTKMQSQTNFRFKKVGHPFTERGIFLTQRFINVKMNAFQGDMFASRYAIKATIPTLDYTSEKTTNNTKPDF